MDRENPTSLTKLFSNLFKERSKKVGIDKYTMHTHVGYLGPKRFFPDLYLVCLNNREEGTVNYHFANSRVEGDFCEMDVIKRLYPDKLHQITEDQYLRVVCHGGLFEVMKELGL